MIETPILIDFNAPPDSQQDSMAIGKWGCPAQGCGGWLIYADNLITGHSISSFHNIGWILECDTCPLVLELTVSNRTGESIQEVVEGAP